MDTLAALAAVPAGSLGAMALGIAVVTAVAWLAALAVSIAAARRHMAEHLDPGFSIGGFIAKHLKAAREARYERLHLSPSF